MSTDWICFVCGSRNDINESVCQECGAERPLAVQGFASSQSNLELPAAARRSSGGDFAYLDAQDCLRSLNTCLNKAVATSADSEKFKFMLTPAVEDFEELYAQVDAFIEDTDDPKAIKALKMRRDDSYYIFKLAIMQLEMYSPNNLQPIRVGLMLIKQAYQGLRWLLAYAKNQQDPDAIESKDLLAPSINAYVKGEIDADTYFDAVCGADDLLSECLHEGCQAFHEALDQAKKFDGQNYEILPDTREDASRANEYWVKAIMAVHSNEPKPEDCF